jgi:hypothetical protein
MTDAATETSSDSATSEISTSGSFSADSLDDLEGLPDRPGRLVQGLTTHSGQSRDRSTDTLGLLLIRLRDPDRGLDLSDGCVSSGPLPSLGAKFSDSAPVSFELGVQLQRLSMRTFPDSVALALERGIYP